MRIARVPRGKKCHIDLQVITFIALAKVDVVIGKPAITVLSELLRIVEASLWLLKLRRVGLDSSNEFDMGANLP